MDGERNEKRLLAAAAAKFMGSTGATESKSECGVLETAFGNSERRATSETPEV